MGLDVKPEVSKKNEFWIEKNRFYELRYFCKQYHYWKRIIDGLSYISDNPTSRLAIRKQQAEDPTAALAERMMYYSHKILLVDDAIKQIEKEEGKDLADYIFKGVTTGLGYEKLDPPCCKEYYYKVYRRFFYYLHNSRE